MNIKFILFDWGGTLGKSGTRQNFLSSSTPMIQRCKSLQKNTVKTLKYLAKNPRVKLGILSNTKHDGKKMLQALDETGLRKYFDKVYVYSSDKGMCRKPCLKIFRHAFKKIRKVVPQIKPHQVLYVGNDYFKDVLGPKRVGFKTALLTKDLMPNLGDFQFKKSDYIMSDIEDLCNIF
jgi:HAD superfamily hydrolase (TIGR01549 family)